MRVWLCAGLSGCGPACVFGIRGHPETLPGTHPLAVAAACPAGRHLGPSLQQGRGASLPHRPAASMGGKLCRPAVPPSPTHPTHTQHCRRPTCSSYGLVRVRENAESIAFYGGEDNEQRLLNARLRAAVDNFLGGARGRGWQACEGWGQGGGAGRSAKGGAGRADRRSKAAAGWRVGCRECKGQGPAVQAGGV